MTRLLIACLLIATGSFANTIVVKNIEELKTANKEAKPGDVIILQNGEWNSVTIALTCNGTADKPITFKAQTPGKVLVTGQSKLKLGGNYIIVDGLYFLNGYAGRDAVISFRNSKEQLANNCRITNCAIVGFNNAKRMEENNWILFYGKNNRLDHCSFIDKQNMGVVLAVILDDERSRENFHSIDHNYFGVRLPLASNGGEIIRVGVSQHCQFNSNTQITDNFFEKCDGEAEVVSIKSCSNLVRGNLFKECQGSVVLRHGDYNTVDNNIFLGNGKNGTGGVRIVNKGQWVVNNFFYGLRGYAFRSPLTVMNGIPNSPAHRYVQVTDAVIANNTFVDCAPLSLCDGSDTERTLPPDEVYMFNNAFFNSNGDPLYKAFDDLSGFHFAGNSISKEISQPSVTGFEKASFTTQKAGTLTVPLASLNTKVTDSLQQVAQHRVQHPLSAKPGFSDLAAMKKIMDNAAATGAKWYTPSKKAKTTATISCKNTSELRAALTSNQADNIIIRLTSTRYDLADPLPIRKNVEITSSAKQKISFHWPEGEGSPTGNAIFFEVKGGCTLKLNGLHLDFSGYANVFRHFIKTDTSRASNHINIIVNNCTFENIQTTDGSFFAATKSTLCDSIVISNSTFRNNNCHLFDFTEETDRKGYYNVEKLVLTNNTITNHSGAVLRMLRGGNDESTLGPKLIFTGNKLQDCKPGTSYSGAMISLTGTQVSLISKNQFVNCYPGDNLVFYEDFVRAMHTLENNTVKASGKILPNKYVVATEATAGQNN